MKSFDAIVLSLLYVISSHWNDCLSVFKLHQHLSGFEYVVFFIPAIILCKS